MSAYNNQQPRQMFSSQSGIFYSNPTLSPHNTYQIQPNIIKNR
jgi:hypothetical protein